MVRTPNPPPPAPLIVALQPDPSNWDVPPLQKIANRVSRRRPAGPEYSKLWSNFTHGFHHLSRFFPALTPLAAATLVIIMVGATVLTLAGNQVALTLIPLVVGLLSAFVAYSRWRLTSHPRASQRVSTITMPFQGKNIEPVDFAASRST